MEGFTRIIQDGERQRALAARRPRAAVTTATDRGVETAAQSTNKGVIGTKSPRPSQWLKSNPFTRRMQKRKQTEATFKKERAEAKDKKKVEQQTSAAENDIVQFQHAKAPASEDEIFELPAESSLQSQRPRSMQVLPEEYTPLPEEYTPTPKGRRLHVPNMNIPRRRRHVLSLTPSIASSISPSLLSELDTPSRVPSVTSQHATAVRLTRAAPSTVAIRRRPKIVIVEPTADNATPVELKGEIVDSDPGAASEAVMSTSTQHTFTRPMRFHYPVRPENPLKRGNAPVKATPRPYLLELRAELRHAIYRYATLLDDDIWVSTSSETSEGKPSAAQQPGIARVNRQIRRESLTIFYTENRFSFATLCPSTSPPPWLKALRPQSRSMIRHIQILTTDVHITIGMMTSIDFQTVPFDPRASRSGPMEGVKGVPTWLTFKAVSFVDLPSPPRVHVPVAVLTHAAATDLILTEGEDKYHLMSGALPPPSPGIKSNKTDYQNYLDTEAAKHILDFVHTDDNDDAQTIIYRGDSRENLHNIENTLDVGETDNTHDTEDTYNLHELDATIPSQTHHDNESHETIDTTSLQAVSSGDGADMPGGVSDEPELTATELLMFRRHDMFMSQRAVYRPRKPKRASPPEAAE